MGELLRPGHGRRSASQRRTPRTGLSSRDPAQPERYRHVVREICRGIRMVSYLPADESPALGWVRVECLSAGMAGWLFRAIVMENVYAWCEGALLNLPAGPGIASKRRSRTSSPLSRRPATTGWTTCMAPSGARLPPFLPRWPRISPLISPISRRAYRRGPTSDCLRAHGGHDPPQHRTSLWRHGYVGWLGLECPSVRAAVWMMRPLVAANVLSRRKEPRCSCRSIPVSDPDGETVAAAVARIHCFATARGIL